MFMKQEFLQAFRNVGLRRKSPVPHFFKEVLVLGALLLCSWAATAQSRAIAGTISDENGDPLIGVTILVKGTLTGTITDVEGNYSLDIPENAEALTISYVGYLTQEVEIGTQTRIDVTMEQD